uniref:hypothetical protein n=1 Tax=Fulvivirga sp. TaxID=1931237 RepID=UPI00404B2D4A
MKKSLSNFKIEITREKMGSIKGGADTCGQTTPDTNEQTITSGGEWDSDPDSYCDDDKGEL